VTNHTRSMTGWTRTVWLSKSQKYDRRTKYSSPITKAAQNAPSRWVELVNLSETTAAYSRKIDFQVFFFFNSKTRLLWIFGSSQTKEGERAFEARSLSSSWISLWCEIMIPPVLHLSAWRTLNFWRQPSQSAMEGQEGTWHTSEVEHQGTL
jgi:hypothetical protein